MHLKTYLANEAGNNRQYLQTLFIDSTSLFNEQLFPKNSVIAPSFKISPYKIFHFLILQPKISYYLIIQSIPQIIFKNLALAFSSKQIIKFICPFLLC